MKHIISIILITAALFVLSCSDEHGDKPTGFSFDAPETPTGLALTPGPNQVALEWTYPGDPADVDGYIIYYYYESYGVEEVIDTVSATNYTDSGLIGNMVYCYKVSALGVNGNEGYRSATECATSGD